MNPDRHEKDLDKLISASIGRENLTFDFETWKQAHQKEVQTYESQVAQAERPAPPLRIWSIIMKNPISKLAAAAVIVIATIVAIQHFVGSVGVTTPAWADVAESFRSVPFFSAAIYIKEDVAAEPKQIELWMSRDGRARLRTGAQVIFGNQGKVAKAFDIKTRSAVEADEHAGFLLEKLGAANEFSLDSVIKVIFGGKLEDVTPLINPDAVISRDMVVFDIQSTISPEWLRIWALRESRLPVRIRVWDPRGGDATDAIFEYSKEQPPAFFDPNAFEQLLRSGRAGSIVNLTYAYLKDPGGKQITPQDMFEDSGYHLPEIEQVGMTPDGAVWVIAQKGRNQTPTGRSFYGFSRLKDDLGREYISAYSSHRTATDVSTQVFVPADYPFDKRVPGRLSLLCGVDDYDPHKEPELIGTVELTEWKQNLMWPAGAARDDEASLRTTLAWQMLSRKDYERLQRITDTIKGEPEENPHALEREGVRLSMLVAQNKFDEATTLGQRLMPLLERDYRAWKGYAPQPSMFTDYILALACTGKLDQAKQTWLKIRAIEPNLPDTLNQRARGHIKESTQAGFDDALRILVPQASRNAHLTVEQLNDIFDIDIRNNEIFRNYTFWDWNPEFEKPKYRNWEKRLGELAEYYKTHPLPEKMELLKQDTKQEYGVRFLKMPGIETHYAEPLRGKLWDYARFYKYPESAGRVRIETDIADIELGHDIVYRIETTQPERIEFVLDRFGLEVIEVNEPRRVWIAHHDGRELKDYKQVKSPIPYDNSGTRKPGMMTSMASAGFDLSYLFRTFMDDQNRNAKADGIIVVDETGLVDKVSLEGPCFAGPEGAEMARKWFKDEIGVTFTEQTHNMTTYVIRKRQAPRPLRGGS